MSQHESLEGIKLEQVAWEVLVEGSAELSECPIFAEGEDALYWVNCEEPALKRTGLTTRKTESWVLPSTVGSYVLTEDPNRVIAGCHDGLYELDLASGNAKQLHAAPYDTNRYRFNDGKCDPRGRYWLGTVWLDRSVPVGSGSYYTLEKGKLRRAFGDVTIANGTVFLASGDAMIIADRINGRLLRFDFDVESGTVSNRRVFTRIQDGEIADGATVDRRGGYWVAMFGSGEIRRYTFEGKLDRRIKTPVTYCTMCNFGGKGMQTMFLTTGRYHMTPEQIAMEPLAGSVFMTKIGESGFPEPRYKFG